MIFFEHYNRLKRLPVSPLVEELDVSGTNSSVPMISIGFGRTTCAYFMPGDKTILFGAKSKKQLAKEPGYDAEANGGKVVYTFTCNGNLDLYVMDVNGKNVNQITHEIGYDGDAFFSPDGKKLVFLHFASKNRRG